MKSVKLDSTPRGFTLDEIEIINCYRQLQPKFKERALRSMQGWAMDFAIKQPQLRLVTGGAA